MSFGDRMRGFASGAQEGVKSGSLQFAHMALRVLTGLFLGLVLSLIAQKLIGYGTFSMLFVMLVILTLVVRGLKFWSLSKILVFDIICILVATVLRMYILLAP